MIDLTKISVRTLTMGTSLLLAGLLPCSADVPASPAESTGSLPLLRTTLPVPVNTEPVASALDWSQAQQWHRATMALSGSICIACLIELENKLRALPGIPYAKISRALPAPTADGVAPPAKPQETELDEKDSTKRIDAVIIYDANAVKFDKLQTFIKNEKYKPTEIKDCPINRSSAT